MIHIGSFNWCFLMNITAYEQLEKIMRHIDGAYAPNTLRAYRSDMLEFIAFAQENGEALLPYSSHTVERHLVCAAQTGRLPQ